MSTHSSRSPNKDNASLEARYAALEQTLATLQSERAALLDQVSSLLGSTTNRTETGDAQGQHQQQPVDPAPHHDGSAPQHNDAIIGATRHGPSFSEPNQMDDPDRVMNRASPLRTSNDTFHLHLSPSTSSQDMIQGTIGGIEPPHSQSTIDAAHPGPGSGSQSGSAPGSQSDEASEWRTLKAAKEVVSNHISLLTAYNNMRDLGLGLMGMLAEERRGRVGEVMEEFGMDKED